MYPVVHSHIPEIATTAICQRVYVQHGKGDHEAPAEETSCVVPPRLRFDFDARVQTHGNQWSGQHQKQHSTCNDGGIDAGRVDKVGVLALRGRNGGCGIQFRVCVCVSIYTYVRVHGDAEDVASGSLLVKVESQT